MRNLRPPDLSPELHAYLVAAVKKFNADQRRDPRWLAERAAIERKAVQNRTRREQALLSSDMVLERLYIEALELLEVHRPDTEDPVLGAIAGA